MLPKLLYLCPSVTTPSMTAHVLVAHTAGRSLLPMTAVSHHGTDTILTTSVCRQAPCPIGHACVGGVKQVCGAGTYQAVGGQSLCIDCPAGRYDHNASNDSKQANSQPIGVGVTDSQRPAATQRRAKGRVTLARGAHLRLRGPLAPVCALLVAGAPSPHQPSAQGSVVQGEWRACKT